MENREIEILLVEDNLNDAEFTIRAFQKFNVGNRLVHLKNGAEALEFFFGSADSPGFYSGSRLKLILLDLKMPKVDGIQVLERLKSSELTKKIPVVVLTSSREDPDIERCYQLGINSYIVKPVDFQKFTEAMKMIGMYWLMLNRPPCVE